MELLTKWARGQWDRIGSWVAFGLAALLLLLGWQGTSDAVFTTQQIPYLISGGMGGLLLSAVGATLWLSADLRDEWRKLDEIRDALLGVDDDAEPDVEEVGEQAVGEEVSARDETSDVARVAASSDVTPSRRGRRGAIRASATQ